MKKDIFCLAILAGMVLTITTAQAESNFTQLQSNYSTLNTDFSNLSGHAIYVPAGITCSIVLTTSVSSDSAYQGQIVEGYLAEDFIYNGKVIAKSGSVVSGTITEFQKQTRGNRNAKMQIVFTSIKTINGIIPINASILTNDSSQTLKGGTTKESAKDYAKTTTIGAASGALLGTALGPLSGGSVGMGAVYGTAIGAGLGIAKTAIKKGDAINIPANSQVTLHFNQPISY